jgi:polyphenol oxidase
MNPPWLLRPAWPAPAGVHSACTLRAGGVSAVPYDSLNLGAHVGDDSAAVASNRRLVRSALRLPDEPLWLAQVHGTRVVDADAIDSKSAAGAPQADGAIARCADRVLAVLVADCLPVLLCRTDGTAVAIAHAGWRGLCGGVLEAAVEALRARAGEVLAWMGPAIGPAHFEVGAEVRTAFCERDAQAALAFVPNARGRWQCDLRRLARMRLGNAGVGSIYGGMRCTYAESQNFFSFRRDGVTGRFAALIWIDSGRAA